MSTIPILQEYFYHDGRGPELRKVVWGLDGLELLGFEYFNPDDIYTSENLKHIRLSKVQAYSKAFEEVHAAIAISGKSKAGIVLIENSEWKSTFRQGQLRGCHHYQFIFYDEVFDIICGDISFGFGAMGV